jgi:protease I
MTSLKGKKVAILVDNYFEESELQGPLEALQDVGATVEIIAAEPINGLVQGMNHINKGKTFRVDKKLSEADIDDYDGLVLPGGAINADQLRMKDKAKMWVRNMVATGRPLAVICHAPWILASAGIAKGHRLTSFYTIQDDMRDAGAEWIDQDVVVDGSIITSRKPDDIPAFNRELIAMLAV